MRKERGVSSLEYVLITVLFGIVSILALTKTGNAIADTFCNIRKMKADEAYKWNPQTFECERDFTSNYENPSDAPLRAGRNRNPNFDFNFPEGGGIITN